MPEQTLKPTPSQTVGPFFGFALPYPGGPDVAPAGYSGAIRFHGTVVDGAGATVPDAILEIWHADPEGRPMAVRGSFSRNGHEVTGFGRTSVNGAGEYNFRTVKPGSARAGSAPYILVTIFARGLMQHLTTRAYFADEAELNAADPGLAAVEESRRSTLLATADGPASYRFDIRLQGEAETVFFDFGTEV